MDFNEKLSRLMTLTETRGNELAKYVNLDSSQISRIKTGVRGRPTQMSVLRMMADFFSERCASDYRLIALAELSDNPDIRTTYAERELSEAIFLWLTDNGAPPYRRSREREKKAAVFCADHGENQSPFNAPEPDGEGDSTYVCYTDNPGKRRAVACLINRMLLAEKPGEAFIFSDEDTQWLYEDAALIRTISDGVATLTDRGWKFIRVAPQLHGVDQAFMAINCWLPAYMKNSVTQFYYPGLRDSLHRRTIIIADGIGAVSARSLAAQRESYFTYLCFDQKMTDVFMREMRDLIRLCQPSIYFYPTPDPDGIFSLLERASSASGDETDRVSSLSVPTMPPEITERLMRCGGQFIQKLAKSYVQCAGLREQVLRKHGVEEIMALEEPETVLAGMAAIPGTGIRPELRLFYTPREYCLHLQRIYDDMAVCGNYNAVFVKKNAGENWAICSKGSCGVLMIRKMLPLAVCEIAERPLAASFCDYLKRISESERQKCDRQETMRKIRETIVALSV